MTTRRYALIMACVLVAGALARVAYVLAQPAVDPTFDRPMLDGLYYTTWARELSRGTAGAGAFYLAPLYPYAVAAFWAVVGPSFTMLYLAQHLAVVGTAGALAEVIRRTMGPVAAIATAVLVLTYGPLLFFASRPLGETAAIALIAAALWALGASRGRWASGPITGLAALARPNLLPLPVLWAAFRFRSLGLRAAAMLVVGAGLVVAPAACHNLRGSGHWVPVAANGGITLYHGNGPGAQGVYTPAAGFSGDVSRQREEATRIASARSGRALDPVAADAWWGRQAISARMSDPWGSVVLLVRRAVLLLDNAEHGLDYAPRQDRNPWRWAAPVGFAVLLGLAVGGIATAGAMRALPPGALEALALCAATPLVFYVSSRYRLPVAAILTIPAGAGVATLAGLDADTPPARRRRGALAALAAAAIALAVPSWTLLRAEDAGGLVALAVAQQHDQRLPDAERTVRQALELDATSPRSWFVLGSVLEAQSRPQEAEAAYRRSLALDRTGGDAAGNLAGLLIGSGRAREAASLLSEVLAAAPDHAVCWNNLVVAWLAVGDGARAREAASQAAARGIALDPALAEAVRGASSR